MQLTDGWLVGWLGFNGAFFSSRLIIKDPIHAKHVAILPSERFVLKSHHAPELNKANCHARLIHSKASFVALTERNLQWPHQKKPDRMTDYASAATKKEGITINRLHMQSLFRFSNWRHQSARQVSTVHIATLPDDWPLITMYVSHCFTNEDTATTVHMYVSDCCWYSDINISHGSVVMLWTCLIITLLEIYR